MLIFQLRYVACTLDIVRFVSAANMPQTWTGARRVQNGAAECRPDFPEQR